MTKKYHEQKVREEEYANTLKLTAIIDYNIMMGKLEDPEQEDNDAQ